MGNSSYFRFDDNNKTKFIYILSIITREMGKLKTYSPTYCIMDNWDNMLNLTHTLDKLYLTDFFISSMSSDKVCTIMIMRWCNVQTNTICKPKRIRLFALIINCTMLMRTNSRFFPECIYNKLVKRPLVARCLILQLGAVIWLEDRVLG